VHTPIVAGVGEILWDLLPDGKQLGGAPANFAYHARMLGAEAYPVSMVGNDPLGREILERLDAVGVSHEFIATDPAHPTGTVSVELEAGIPRYVIHNDVAWDNLALTGHLLTLARRLDGMCFGTLAQRSPHSRAAIMGFIEATSPRCVRVLDINLRQQFYDAAIIEASLAHSQMVKLNDEELPVVAGVLGLAPGTEDSLMEQLVLRYDLALVALTRGNNGSRLFTPEAISDHPGYRTTVADTIGAGDAFTAALLVGYLRGHVLDVINDEANRLASFVCSRIGAMPRYET